MSMSREQWTIKAKVLIECHQDIIKDCDKYTSSFYKLKKQKSLDVIEFIETALKLIRK